MKRKRIPRPTRRQAMWAAGAVAAGAAAFAVLGWMKPRTIGVCVVSDYSFRQQHANWREYLDARFEEANRIFSGTGVRWDFRHADQPDPTGKLRGMEQRRQKLVRTECEADLILGVTAQPESRALGDAPPFAHTAMVVDDPKAPESQNGRVLAQALAMLFGAPADARGAGTVMTQPPEGDRLPKSAIKLISQLREYDFAKGAAGLEGAHGDRALRAIAAANAGRGNAESAAHRTLGLALAADGLFAAAVRHFEEVVKLDPGNAAAHVQLATMYGHSYQHAEAVKHHREAARLEPNNAAHHAGLAVSLANAGDIETAVDEFHAALRINPKFAVAQAGLAYLLSQQVGRIDESIAAYRTALEMNPELPAATEGLERAQGFKEKAQAAAAEQRRKAQQSPSAGALFDLGLSEARAGNVDPAVKAFRRALELDGRNARAHANLAMLLYLQKDYPQALQEAQTAKREGFDPPPALMELLKRKNLK